MKIIGLDVGTKRIGVAKADTNVRIAIPAGVVMVNGREFAEIAKIAREYGAQHFVIGLPRNSSGTETAQSKYTRAFARNLAQCIPHAKIRFQDETLTSVEAASRLGRNGRPVSHKSGEIDTEAACIILQDFIESFTVRPAAKPTDFTQPDTTAPDTDFTDPEDPEDYLTAITRPARKSGTARTLAAKRKKATSREKSGSDRSESAKKSKKSKKSTAPESPSEQSKKGGLVKKLATIIISLAVVFGILGAGLGALYRELLKPVSDTNSEVIKFTVSENESVPTIANNLQNADLIRSKLAFQLHAQLSKHTADLKVGEYDLKRTMSTQDILSQIVAGSKSGNVFDFTIKPGETIAEIKENLNSIGYDLTRLDVAFSKAYDHPVLKDKPADVSLEGYLYPETYQFYREETIENIITRAMDELYRVVVENDLETKFKAQNLNLHQGITLASIVQKESGDTEQMRTIAQVFLLRLDEGISLGSDVTASYAANLVDPDRKILKGNEEVLAVDSPYNTRKYAGLTPGAIASPGFDALTAVGNPTKTTYLYFLTGDDGMMYYSNTEEEHLKNASEHCQTLCNVSL